MPQRETTVLPWKFLGRRPYQEIWDLQETLRKRILTEGARGELLLVEHPPTLTLGRGETGANLFFETKDLRARGFDVVTTNRGGMVTYHGPGQLVAYPVVDLRVLRTGVKGFVAGLEQTMIRCLSRIGITADRRDGCIGTWVGGKKIGSIGIHVRKQVSIHGLALNVTTNLEHFDVIRACGIDGVRLTSVAQEGVKIDLDGILSPFVSAFAEVFGLQMEGTFAHV